MCWEGPTMIRIPVKRRKEDFKEVSIFDLRVPLNGDWEELGP